MSRKNVVMPYKMFDEADMSANATSDVTNVINLDKASIIISWSGSSPVGAVTVEGRSFRAGAEPVDSGWVTLDFDVIAISGNSGGHQLLFNELPFSELRLQYAFSSGSGSLDAVLVAKQVGG